MCENFVTTLVGCEVAAILHGSPGDVRDFKPLLQSLYDNLPLMYELDSAQLPANDCIGWKKRTLDISTGVQKEVRKK